MASWLKWSSINTLQLLAAGALLLSSAARAAPAADPRPAQPVASVTLKLPPDIVYDRTVGPDSAVVFSHETHVALEQNRCLSCHPQPFKLLTPTHRIRHADMIAGRSCGTCHSGREGAAFGVRDLASCSICHSGRRASQSLAAKDSSRAGAAAAPRLPKPWTFQGSDASPGKVTFRHETHMSAKSTCATCHPKPFGMKPPKAAGMAMHEAAACGGCHDGARAFGVENTDACGRCHAEGGAGP